MIYMVNKNVTKEYSSLLCDFRKGDVEAFRVIYEKWRKPVFMFLRKMIGSEEDARDITQDVFSTLWEMREKIDPSKDVKSLIYLIARRITSNYMRKIRSRNKYLSNYEFDLEDSADSQSIVIEKEIKLLTRYALEIMPETQRRVFELNFYGGLSNTQIAEELQISNGSVRVHLHEARKCIKNVLVASFAIALLL